MTIDRNPYTAPLNDSIVRTPRWSTKVMLITGAWSGSLWPIAIRVAAETLLGLDTDYTLLQEWWRWVLSLVIVLLVWWLASVGLSIVCLLKSETRLAGLVGLFANMLAILLLC